MKRLQVHSRWLCLIPILTSLTATAQDQPAQDQPFEPSSKQRLDHEQAINQRRNPFDGRPIDPPTPQQRDKLINNQLRTLEIQVRNTLQRMQSSPNRGEQLERILASLHYPSEETDGFGLLKQLAALNWPDADVEPAVAQATSQWIKNPSPSARQFIALGKKYVAAANTDFPFNWRTHRSFWQSITIAMARSSTDKDPVAIWKALLANTKDPTEQSIVRMGYLAAISNGSATLDVTMVDPLHQESQSPLTAMIRLGEIYSVANSKGQFRDAGVQLARIWDQLPKVGKLHEDGEGHVPLLMSLGKYVGRPLLPLVVKQASPQLFAAYCRQAGLSDNETASQFLAKPTIVKWKQVSLRKAVDQLLDQVQLAVWVDLELTRDQRLVELDSSGAWKEAMQALATSVDYRFTELADGVFYFGPLNKLKLASPMLARSYRKIPVEGGPDQWRAAQGLKDGKTTPLIEVPWHDVLELMSDMNGVTIQADGVPNPAVTSLSRNLPLHLALSVLCYEADCQWTLEKDGTIKVTVDPNPPRQGDEQERREAEGR